MNALRRALVRFGRHGTRSLVAVLTVALALLVGGAVLLGAVNAARLGDRLRRRAAMTAYLADGTGPLQAAPIVAALRRFPGVASVRYAGPEESARRLREGLGPRGAQALADVEPDLFPAALEVVLAASASDAAAARLAAQLGRLPAVVEVDDLGERARRLRALERSLRWLGLLLLLVVAVACVGIATFAVGMAVIEHREEIGVERLVGATERYVAAPFFVEGALIGGLGATVAASGLYALFQAARPHLGPLFTQLGGASPVFVPATSLALAAVAAALLGVVGSRLAVGRHLRA